MNIFNIAIVEDEPLMGRLLKESIESKEMHVDLYASGVEVLEYMDEDALPDIILMDINIPDISGIELTYILKDRFPKVEIIVQTVIEDTETIVKAIKAGASGYLLKASLSEDVMNAIDIVRQGGSFLTGKIAKKVLLEFQQKPMFTGHKDEHAHEEIINKPVVSIGFEMDLSKKEEEILQELIKGASSRDIAEKFGTSFHTVNTHIRRIYQKMQVNSRGELLAKAIVEMKKKHEIHG